jgi:hypothetical protein
MITYSRTVLALIFLTTAAVLPAQAPRSVAGVEQMLDYSKSRLELREQRLEELRSDIILLDERIERRTDKIVAMLAQTKDSTESNVTITNQKRSAVEGLVGSIQLYQDKRNEFLTELARSKDAAERAKLEEGLGYIDERIEARIDNISQISRSLSRSPGYKTYQKDQTAKRDKGNKHEARVGQTGEIVRRELDEVIRASMSRIEQENANYRRHLERDDLSPENRELVRKLLAQNEAQIAHREDQVIGTLTAETRAKSIGRAEANTMSKAIEEVTADLQQSLTRLFWLSDRILEERKTISSIKQTVAQLETDLAAAKAGAE